eukprot:TRINITY_DN3117_c0_g1_i3.p1 TRINITY_DN3117_c0_g1~~TRINITY_DN3117_c0_g1_i3.p1  ORF type:complete len:412 (-),score=43.32 TRINITY_DN3117_c0_g1_i3:259-1494(-)
MLYQTTTTPTTPKTYSHSEKTPLVFHDQDGATSYLGVENVALLERKGTVWGSISNLMNSAIGAGILSLPFAYKSSGLMLGVILTIILAVSCGYSLILIAQTAEQYPQCSTYEKLVNHVYGPKWALVVTACIILQTVGACTGFLIIIGDLLPPIFVNYAPNAAILHDRIFITAVVSIIFILPLACQKHFHSLRFSSVIAISSILFVVLIIIIRFAQLNAISGNNVVYFNNSYELLASLPLICFALSCHMQMVPIHAEMDDHMATKKVRIVSFGSQLVCSILYISVGIFGYLLFLNNTKGNIMDNFRDDDNLVNAARIILSVVIICHYPSSGHCLRSSVDYLLFRRKGESTLRRIGSTFAIWLVCFGLAIAVPHIEVVFGFIGGTVGSILSFLFPGCMFYPFFVLFLISFHHS